MSREMRPDLAPQGLPGLVPVSPPWRLRRFFAELGPGLITGAADDDPSGISTYSVAGAAFGYAPLWTALVLVSPDGRGPADVRAPRHGVGPRAGERHPAPLFPPGALGSVRPARGRERHQHRRRSRRHGRGERDGDRREGRVLDAALRRLHRVPAASGRPTARSRASSSGSRSSSSPTSSPRSSPTPTGGRCCAATFVPHVEWSNAYLATFVGILGTTISPYLFFWQAAQEVEEDRAAGRRTVAAAARRDRRGAAADADGRR